MQVKGEGRDVYKFECVPDYAYACLSMYFHTIYTYAVFHCGCAPLYITLCSKTVTLVDMSVPSQACVYIHVHVRTLRGNVCTPLRVALHLEKQ